MPAQGDMPLDEILQSTLVLQAANPARDPPVEIKILCVALSLVLQEDKKKYLT